MNGLFSIIDLLSGFCVGLLLTPLVAAGARRCGLVDHPDFRKRHSKPTPLVGGPVLLCAALLGLLWAGYSGASNVYVVVGMGMLAAVGIVDDRFRVSAWWRLLAEGLTTICLVGVSGLGIGSLGRLDWGSALPLGEWSLPFTVFAVVGVVNAINMVDGVDGLAGGLTLVALVLLWLAASSTGSAPPGLWLVAFAVGGGLASFLVYNAPVPWRRGASVFLGDGGSLSLGFFLACVAVETTQGEHSSGVPPILAVWFLGLPIMDTVTVMVRRALSGKSPFHPDRTHMHHLFLRRGWSVGGTTYFLCGLQAMLGLGAWEAWRAGASQDVLCSVYVLLFTCYFLATYRMLRRPPVAHDWTERSYPSFNNERSFELPERRDSSTHTEIN